MAPEINALGLTLFKAQKVDLSELEAIQAQPNIDIAEYNKVVRKMVAKSFSGSLQSLELIGGMLSPNPQEQPKLEDFKIKKEEIQAPVPEKEKNEAMIEEESDAEIQDATEELKIILSNDMRMMNFSPDPKMYSAEMRSPGDSSATRSQNVQRGGYQQSNGAAYQGGNTPADSRTNEPTNFCLPETTTTQTTAAN